ncbi:hypothetical protein [Kitasatospora sp. NPDC015120]|uniref:hypothetical protein n=1 Tax=Kitasatospora sp. NPDC015120 TaxID=3364023 RepID=UPI0036F48D6C
MLDVQRSHGEDIAVVRGGDELATYALGSIITPGLRLDAQARGAEPFPLGEVTVDAWNVSRPR